MHNVLDTALADGEAKGRREGEKKKETEIIQNMLLSGMDIAQIVAITKIPEAEIQKIKEQK